MDLVHEMTYHALLRPPLVIGDGPFGTRMPFEAIEGELEGLRIRIDGRLYPGFGVEYRVDRVL